MGNITFTQIHPQNFLSFGPDTEPIRLERLNVLIGPNGSGKSNLIEAFELLQATPGDLAGYFRQGGGVEEFQWKGKPVSEKKSRVAGDLEGILSSGVLEYQVNFGPVNYRLEVFEESLREKASGLSEDSKDLYHYSVESNGLPLIRRGGSPHEIPLRELSPQQSILSQRKDPTAYPELTAFGRAFEKILVFKEWRFGRENPLRQSQPADLPVDAILPDLGNLNLVLKDMEVNGPWDEFSGHLQRFLPSFAKLSFGVYANSLQLFLHEKGFARPIPATRLSDGTLRFIALLAILLNPEAASFICLEEPELGLHPDAISLLGKLLIEASQKTQLLVTTHSDALISALSETPESVLVAEKLGGSTILRRLEAAKLRTWLDKYTLGDIWRMGELGGNP